MEGKCKEVCQFAEVRLTVEVSRMLECPVCPLHSSQEMERLMTVERSGRAMNQYELAESLPDFLIKCAIEVLQEACAHDRALAGTLLGNAIAEAVEGERTF